MESKERGGFKTSPLSLLRSFPPLLVYPTLFLLAAYLINFFFLGFLIGPFDYDHLSGYWEIAYRFWKTGQPSAQFNPFLCGGRTLGGDPQIPLFHPFLFLVPLLGPTLLIKWEMLGQLALGLLGLWGMLTAFQLSRPQKLWGLFLYAAGGAVMAKFLVGHVTLGFFFLYPLFFYFSYYWEEQSGHGARLALLAYWVLFIYSGAYKPNFVVYGLLPLGVEHAVRALLTRKWRPLFYFVVGALLCGLANASHYLPSWRYFHDFPRLDGSEPHAIPFYTLLANLLLPLKTIPKAWYGEGFLQRHEYNVFLGPVALGMALRYLTKERWVSSPRYLSLFVFTIVCAVLGMGSQSPDLTLYSPYTWAQAVWPGFKTIRVPTRFWFGVSLGVLIFSAAGFHWPTTKRRQILFFLFGICPLLAMGIVNLFKTTALAHQTQFTPPRAYPHEFQWVKGELNHEDSYAHLRQGVGVLQCVENLENYRSRQLQEGPLLKRLSPSPALSHWSAEWKNWSEFRVEVESATELVITLNLTHSPYWQTNQDNAAIISSGGEPLALKIAAGKTSIELSYDQPGEAWGIWISRMTFLLFSFFAFFWGVRPWWKKQRRFA